MSSNQEPSKIVVLGSCSVDFTTYAPRLPNPGETLHGTKFTTSFGGKGANQCVASAKLGGNCYMICRLGDDQWGEKYKNNFKEFGVDVSHVYQAPNITTGVAQITVAESGENQIVIVTGANGHLSKADVASSEELIRSADVLIGQLETPFETTLEAFKICKGVKLLNAAPARADIVEILPYCSILCVNESEASTLTNLNVHIGNAVEALKELLSTGCGTVIITLGEKGAVYASKTESPTHVFCKSVTAVDTTDLLLEIMRKSAPIVENKLTDTNTNRRKKLEWVNIQNKLKELTGKPRDIAQLKGFWRRSKVAAKKSVSQHRRALQATGGGQRPPSPSPEDLKILEYCPTDFVIDENDFDSDSVLQATDFEIMELGETVTLIPDKHNEEIDQASVNIQQNEVKVLSELNVKRKYKTEGAGDAFVGSLATFLVSHRGLPMHQIIGAACDVASISVTKEGTQTSYPTNYTAFAKEFKYTRLQ